MKNLLVIFLFLFSFGASAQTFVYDTTVVKSPLGVVSPGGNVKDSLYIQPATTSQNGYMSSLAMQQLTALASGTIIYPSTNTQVGSTYTVQLSDFNKLINMTNNAATVITLPTNITNGWRCTVMQSGGTITFAAAGGVTIRSPFSYKRSQTQYGVITVISLGSNIYSISGNLKL